MIAALKLLAAVYLLALVAMSAAAVVAFDQRRREGW